MAREGDEQRRQFYFGAGAGRAHADSDNYPLLLPVVVAMRAKYRQYEPSDAVKQEIRERKG